MKKVLLATTALVVSAGVAQAELNLSGSANVGVTYDESRTTDELRLQYEVDFGVSGATMTDSGIAVGASIDLDSAIDSATGDPATTTVDTGTATGSTEIDPGITDPEIFISGAFGTATFGAVDVATDGQGIPDAGFDDIGLDDAADGGRVVGSANIHYTYTFQDFGIVLSYHTILDDYGILLQYNGPTFSVGLGYADDDDGADAFTIDGAVTLPGISQGGDVTVEAIYTDNSASGDHYGLSVAYDLGATNVVAVVSDSDASTDTTFGVGASMDLGGGVSVAGAIGSVDGDFKADFGITMSF